MIDILWTIVAFAAILVLLIFVHEMGHFVTAKASGVKVEEFGFGYPPRIFGMRWRGTLYSLNLLPFGGFVRLLGEEDPQQKGSLASKRIRTRLMVLSAGSIMNALLPIVLLSLSFMVPREQAVGQIQVKEVAPGSPAERAGIEPGDVILSINGQPVENSGDLRYYAHLYLGRRVALELERPGSPAFTAELVPRWKPPAGEGALGVAIGMNNVSIVTRSYPAWRAVPLGVRTLWETLVLLKNEVLSWFIRQTPPQVAGPLGIAQITGEVARAGLSPLLAFTAFLSLNLAILNLFPIPGLDGGRIAFVIVEWLRGGRRLPPHREGLVHLIGFAMLMAAVILVSYNDILRIVRGESLLP